MKIILPKIPLFNAFFPPAGWIATDRTGGFSFLGNRTLALAILLSALLSTIAIPHATAQNLKGQWIGNFKSLAGTDTSGKTDYIIELESTGEKIIGYSYTYFAIAGKRYYVICRLEGNYEKGSKSLQVNEVETIKTNTPPNFQNCLQSHQLTYFKQSDKEMLMGKWKPTKPGSDCGKGFTELERKLIKKIPTPKNNTEIALNNKNVGGVKKTNQPNIASQLINKDDSKTKGIDKTIPLFDQPKNQQVITQKPGNAQNENNFEEKSKSLTQNLDRSNKEIKENQKLLVRSKQFIKTIEATGKSIHIDIYDNGQIDGDTVSIFLNDKLLVPSKKLTTVPISIDVKIEDNIDVYDITMFAESLGSIPPNTALMIVNTSTERFEINITSTEQTSGAVRIKVKR